MTCWLSGCVNSSGKKPGNVYESFEDRGHVIKRKNASFLNPAYGDYRTFCNLAGRGNTGRTFRGVLRGEWNFTPRHAYRFIDSARVIEN